MGVSGAVWTMTRSFSKEGESRDAENTQPNLEQWKGRDGNCMWTLPSVGAQALDPSNSREGRKKGPRGRCDPCDDDKEGRTLYEIVSILSV